MKLDETTRRQDNVTHRCSSQWSVVSGRWSSSESAFTLTELAVTMGVLVLLVFLFTQLLNSAATITMLGHKKMDADSQARQLLDRMAIDFAQMVKRSDVDYYLKSSATPPPTGVRNVLQLGNDTIAFYSTVPGYYPPTGLQSPVSLVAYRINAQNKLERIGKGLVWNGVSTTDTPVVFMPIPLASPIPTPEMPVPAPNPIPTPAWPNVADPTLSPTPEPSAEVIGPQVFRFEYYYLLTNGNLSGTPFLNISPTPTPPPITIIGVNGMRDVAAIIVDIAVIDPKSKVSLTDAQIAEFSTPSDSQHFLVDYTSSMTPGQLRAQWQDKLNGLIDPNSPDFDSTLPPPAISGIRVYERYFYLTH